MKSDRIVWWLKKDFRLEDNPALTFALSNAKNVLPVFVLEPSALNAPETSAFHVGAWLEAIKSLRTRLRKEGGDICALVSEVVPAFDRLREIIDFEAVVSHVEIGSDRTFQRDKDFAKWCSENGVKWTELKRRVSFVVSAIVTKDLIAGSSGWASQCRRLESRLSRGSLLHQQ
ncbi:deoxyribodipyrimidine photo-lyase [Mariniblastus sp.]|nr:deoxyribodipyrimidine photo-lyase [Mariniblastus sp.]